MEDDQTIRRCLAILDIYTSREDFQPYFPPVSRTVAEPLLAEPLLAEPPVAEPRGRGVRYIRPMEPPSGLVFRENVGSD